MYDAAPPAPEAPPVEEAVKGELNPIEAAEAIVAKAEAEKAEEEEAVEEETPVREEGEESAEDAPVEEEAPVKVLKTKVNDQDLEIPEDAEFDVKIDGKVTKVKLAEMVKHAQSGVSVEKRYENFKKEQDAFKAEKERVQLKETSLAPITNALVDLGKTGDSLSFVQKLAEFAEIDPVKFETHLLDTLTPVVQRWAALSDIEKNTLVLQRQNTVNSKKLSKFEADRQSSQQQLEMKQQLDQLILKENITEGSFVEAFNELLQLKEGGHLDAEITPLAVVEYVHVKTAQTKVISALEKVNPSLKENSDVVSFLTSEARANPDLNEADLEEIVQDAFGKGKKAKAEDRLNKKLNSSDTVMDSKTSTKTPSPGKQERVAGNSSHTTPWTFNEM